MAERPFEIPVLIVGGGPVGLACSLMLTRFGVRSLLVELQKHKVKVVDPPADYPDYGEGYYAVFFTDPDGLKLEGMVCKPPPRRKAGKPAAKRTRGG